MTAGVGLSVVIPCYRGAPTAVRSAARLADAFHAWGVPGEIIIVDDGSGGFAQVALPESAVVLAHERNRGKGAAVRTGVLGSQGAVVVYTDVDLPYGIEAIWRAAWEIEHRGFHLVLGDRWLPDSRYSVPRSTLRRFLSRLSATAVGSFLTGGFSDTQCGLKALPGPLARALFAHFVVDGFAFEVELVHTALALGLDIKRLRVTQETDGPSSVKVFHHSGQALVDLLRVRLRSRALLARLPDLVPLMRTSDYSPPLFDSQRLRMVNPLEDRTP